MLSLSTSSDSTMFHVNRSLQIDKIHSIRGAISAISNRYFNGLLLEKPHRIIRTTFTLSPNTPLISNLNLCKFSVNSKWPFSTAHASLSLEKVSKDSITRILSFYLKHQDGKMEEYALPYSWLRDACQCTNCFDPNSLARIQLMKNFDPECTPQDVTVISETQELHVVWTDGHKSTFPIDFLRKRNFTKEGESIRKQLFQLPQSLPWSTELQGKIKSFKYKDLIDCDQTLLSFLEELCIYGIAFMVECPKDCQKFLIPRVAYHETTNYGLGFTVISKTNPSNPAYTSGSLNHHSDLSYYEVPPGVQMLHCISQDGNIIGGENTFADGLFCSLVLKEQNPLYYDTLCTELIDRYDYGSDYLNEFHFMGKKLLFELDKNGNFRRINYGNHSRDTFMFNVPLEKVDLLFRALKTLDDIILQNSVQNKLKSGEMAVFDNHRVLHARNSYEVKGQSQRHLHGCYWRWDEIYSRMRRLKAKTTGQSLI